MCDGMPHSVEQGRTGRVLINVPYIDQSGTYPTGCESVSAVMLLRFLGVDITVDEFIENYLEQKEFEQRDGELYGPDPRKYFCGSPYDEGSFGCYAPVIARALGRALDEWTASGSDGVQRLGQKDTFNEADKRYIVVDETGTPTAELLHRYIEKGMPVIYWACINMREPVAGPEWKLFDTGETFIWISNEHCMLLVGYDKEGYYFNDPYGGNGVIRYPKEVVEKRHGAQHMQAVAVVPR